ncbi:MAG: EAL domain-containing protein [Gammaproteobacteria bacterium]
MSKDKRSVAVLTVAKRLLEMLAIALAYIATAKLGFMLAIPPGNVTPVWPPSGLALAATLVLGYRSGLGIWLGSFSANLWFFTQTIAFSTAPLIMASSIATGSTLQAFFAAFLLRRVVGTSRPEGLCEAIKFLGIAAVSCLIASCVGVTTLVLASLVPLGNYPYTWFIWWLGDLAGILIVTPVLIFLSQRSRPQLSSQMAFPLLGFGSGLTLIAFFALWQMDRQAVEVDFQRRAEDIVSSLRRTVEIGLLELESTAAFYSSSPEMTREGFHRFVTSTGSRNSPLQTTAWVPWVLAHDRPILEAAARQEGHTRFQITEQNARGELGRAADRAEYFPVFFVEPRKGNEQALGFDFASEPTRRQALLRARESGEAVATGPLELVLAQQTGSRHGFLILYPVYRPDERIAALKPPPTGFRGFVVGVFRIGVLVDRALNDLRRQGIDVYFYDESFVDEMKLLHVYSASPTHAALPGNALPDAGRLRAALHHAASLAVGERRWLIVCRPGVNYLGAADSFWPLGFLLAGLSFTALLSAYLEAQRKQGTFLASHRDLEAVVQVRTRELTQANEQLRAEVSEREHARASLREAQARLRLALRASNTGLWDWNLNTNKVYFSPEWKRQLGYEDHEVPNRYEEWQTRLHPEDREGTLNAVRASVENPACGFEMEFRLRHKDGSYRWILARASLLEDPKGTAYRMLGSHTDITERKEAEDQLAQLALYDSLTGLANRHRIEEELERALIASRRREQKIAVMFIDLDRFKDINDTLGHEAGDYLLKQVAARVRSEVRESDAVARLGGDEFVVVLNDIARAEDAANVARKILKTLSAPVEFGDANEIIVSASIGISVSPEDGSDVKTLLRHADAALYHAKEDGKGDYCFHTASLSARAEHRRIVESGLRHALDRQEFFLEYQPVVAPTGLICGAEVLLRWRHPKQGVISPAEFISVAEESGFIIQIGEWVLQAACAQLQAWQSLGYGPLRFALNLSPRQLRQPEFITKLQDVLSAIGDRAQCLEFEVTESTLMIESSAVLEALQGLKELGIALVIDDFGTGYGSLAYLKRFPIDGLKIDRSFVQDITIDPSDRAIVKAIIAMARSLDLRVVAEGVETEEQLSVIREYGCHEYQGYFFSPAIEADAFTRLMQHVAPLEPVGQGS